MITLNSNKDEAHPFVPPFPKPLPQVTQADLQGSHPKRQVAAATSCSVNGAVKLHDRIHKSLFKHSEVSFLTLTVKRTAKEHTTNAISSTGHTFLKTENLRLPFLKHSLCRLWSLSLKCTRPRVQALLAVEEKCFNFYRISEPYF